VLAVFRQGGGNKEINEGGLIFCSLKKGENKKSNKNKEGVKKFSPSI
jgi:hypothetical protein